MGKLILRSAEINNFKGIESLKIEFSAGRTDIYGANGTGKSTIVDAYNWCLWGKDSKGNSDGSDNFREKPLDRDGHEKHNLTTSVKLEFLYNDKPLSLERKKSERWERRRGTGESVFFGNTVAYLINGIETKAAEYKAAIAGIASEEATRFIGTLGAFNSAEWKMRRAILTEMADAGEIARKLAEAFPNVASVLESQGVTLDQLKKNAMAKRKEAVKLTQELPVRIAQTREMLPEVDAGLVEQKFECEQLLAEAQRDIAKEKARLEALDTGKELDRLMKELDEVKNKQRAELLAEVAAAESVFNASLTESKALGAQVKNLETSVAEAEATTERLRKEWKDAYELRIDNETKCPVCGQELPEQAREELKQILENERLKKLQDISDRGKAAAASQKELKEVMLSMVDKVEKAVNRNAESQTKLKEAKERYEGYINDQWMTDKEQTLWERVNEISKADTEQPETSDELETLTQREAELKARVDECVRAAAVAEQRAGAEKMLEKLEESLSEAQGNAVESERALSEIEGYSRALAEFTEQAINASFSYLKWRLFTEQVNGERAETCVCMIPCGDSLVTYQTANTASQINADIEIVKLLKKHYDVEMPLFVDNKERVTELTDTEGIQVITLSVSDDKELRIERR